MHKLREDNFLGRALVQALCHKFPYALVMLLAILAGALVATWPSQALRRIVDGPLAGNGESLWRYAFLYLGAMLAIGLADLLREYGAMVFGQGMLLRIRTIMLERLRLMPVDYYLDVPVGETMARFTSDIDAVNSLFTAGLIGAAADLLKIGGLLIALFALSVPVGYIAIGALPVIYFISDYFRRNIYRRQVVVRKRVSDINTGIQEVYAGMKVIKVFGLERRFAERFEPLLENHRLAMNANSVFDAWFPCILQTVRAAVIASVLVLGAKNNSTPVALGLSLGALAAAADLMVRLFDPIEAAAGELQTIQQAMAGLARIRAFFQLPTEEDMKARQRQGREAGAAGPDPSIVVEGVRFSYKNGVDVLQETSLYLPAGTKAAIAGRTGSGKTTLLNLVAGLYPPAGGRILVGGQDPYLIPPAERRRLIGIVPQNVVVFHGSIYENITLRDDTISREQAEKALGTVGLLETVYALPQGIDTLIGEGAAGLSFGQTQLLSLARALVTDPPLLLLDELTSGLDALTERKVLDAIRQVSGRKTILTISHRLSGIIDADTVHIMERGRIMEHGSPLELAAREGWYSRYKRLEDLGWKIS